ncbi:sigma factor-like helix-turn-helix DNA-binding protein [Herbidospora cretacea]|uniref:sigma factor-like helix-turn-helix DNA-binding protein n=1 Tax=Herbidospora cretacea TaxID=28444 RepID=UPI000773EE9C|nr:sigma factor-like helix-turn-helix DNA-binding protein [Herbidospora cretacea]
MPGWPTVGRADDHRLLDALKRSDAHAPASLYDAYADRLNDYAYSRLHDLDLAASAVHDALVLACASVGRLTETQRLRAWLYALVRFQCAARTPGPATGPIDLADSPDPEMTALVHEALGELSGPEREVLELSLRHDLTPAEAGAVLGLTSRQAATRLERARDHLENSAAAVVLARTGRAHCPDLSAMVDSWDGPLSTLLRQRLSRHIGGCEVCTEGRQRHVAAPKLLEMVPVAFPPLSLRRRVVDTCAHPERDETKILIAQEGDHFDRDGFPVPVGRRPRVKRGRRAGGVSRRAAGKKKSRRATPAVAALGVVLIAGGGVFWLNGASAGAPTRIEAMPQPQPTDDTADGTVQAPQYDVDTDPPAEEPIPDTPSPEPAEAVETSSTRAPAPVPTAAGVPSARPTPTRAPARPRPTKRPPAAKAALSMTCPGDVGDATGEVLYLTARNAPIAWRASAGEGVSIAPTRGMLQKGASGRMTISIVNPRAAGSATIAITSPGGNPSCRITWRGDGYGPPPGGWPDPTSQPPRPTPTPTKTDEPTSAPTETPATQLSEEPQQSGA